MQITNMPIVLDTIMLLMEIPEEDWPEMHAALGSEAVPDSPRAIITQISDTAEKIRLEKSLETS